MIQGVNLGGWFALERWMTPSLFAGLAAQDEQEFYEELGFSAAEERLKNHWDTFITEADFARIARWGLRLVRLPVPYTVFGDVPGRAGCLPWVDRAFAWAERCGLSVLLDLHTVPGSANGLENGGVCGLCRWHLDPRNTAFTLDVLKRLTERYAGSASFWGIEPVNEPASEEFFHQALRGYRERYADRLAVSAPVPSEFLRNFYLQVWQELSGLLGPDRRLVLHDGFRLEEWDDFMPRDQYPQVLLDTHLYLNFARYTLQDQRCDAYLRYALDQFAPQLAQARRHHDILVGEWSLAHRPADLADKSAEAQRQYYRACGEVQKYLFSQSAGWVYYSYRVDDPERPAWDLRTVYRNQWLCP